ncbi:hypothetical protein RV08_GL002346 [Enterococcus mundtii]|nr:hypothetical protein RV08_GL002346 [Enterococcus mundtii]
MVCGLWILASLIFINGWTNIETAMDLKVNEEATDYSKGS